MSLQTLREHSILGGVVADALEELDEEYLRIEEDAQGFLWDHDSDFFDCIVPPDPARLYSNAILRIAKTLDKKAAFEFLVCAEHKRFSSEAARKKSVLYSFYKQ